MFGRLALLAAALLALLWFLHWFRRTPPERVARTLRKAAIFAAIGFFVLLAVTGRLHWLFAAAAAGVPAVMRVWNLARSLPLIRQLLAHLGVARSGSAGSRGQTSSIRTRFLDMTLEHDSGDLDGVVLEGEYRGLRLSDLGLDQVTDLLHRCRREDDQSASLLEAYMDHNFGDDWRDAEESKSASGNVGSADAMTAEEAWEVLGLKPGASEQEIRDSHRRLMQKLHPDRGGSTYLAAKINQAKKLLLG